MDGGWPMPELIAARGYVVFAPNFRGSDNLGNAYQSAVFNDAVAGPGRDAMAGVKYLEGLGYIDTSREAVCGWSYGGLMTSWLTTQVHTWRAAVAGAAENDFLEQYADADHLCEGHHHTHADLGHHRGPRGPHGAVVLHVPGAERQRRAGPFRALS